MRALGDKVRARRLAIKMGVKVAQGSEGALADAKEARDVAKDVGYPVMLKASAGGGGMGMRVVHEAKELEKAFASASEQAQKAFGDGAMFLEKYLERPRHIEVQVLGDADGSVRHLFERECSIQRRHQKLIEEAPSPGLDDAQRREVADRAVTLAEAAGYTNAGTVEFLFQDGEFYFNEVNTRLQVEHPVTEAVTGVDLVAWQVRIAAGQALTLRQEDVALRGHAVECRLNAEDPVHQFRPTPGPVTRYEAPQGPGVRIDTALYTGWTVPSQYDNLVAKIITWAPDRDASLSRMRLALTDLRLDGFTTNRSLHLRILDDEVFAAGELSTRFLEERKILEALEAEAAGRRREAALVASALAMAPQGGLGSLAVRHTMPPRRQAP
jgi:acetyl/propionyl-CoA carboxylase alpha subunit